MSDTQRQPGPDNETDEEREARLEAERIERERGLPGGAPEGLRAAADGEALPADKAAEMEAGALDFLCGDNPPVPFTVEATVEAKEGPRKVTFHMVQLDGDRLDELEKEHRREDEGPLFGTVNVFALNCAIVAEATRFMVDPKGGKVEVGDPKFIGSSIAPRYAFERAFKRQPGIANMIAAEVRRMAGLQEDLVGKAKRENAERTMTTAVGNS
jgi:hypothetical protein